MDVRLPGPSIDDLFAITPDSRTIYYGAARAEADIWIVERTKAILESLIADPSSLIPYS